MTLAVNHLHLKTRDPKRTMQFYIDNFGATFVAEIGTRGYRVNLHGLTLNITTIVDGQTRSTPTTTRARSRVSARTE